MSLFISKLGTNSHQDNEIQVDLYLPTVDPLLDPLNAGEAVFIFHVDLSQCRL